MPYGIIKVDQVTFTNAGVDQTISVSGIVASISGNITATGTISGNVIRGGTTVSGATVTGTAGQFGTITGNTAGFTTVTGATITGTTLTVASGTFTGNSTAAAFIPTGSTVPTNGVYLPSANNVAISTNGTGRLFVDASGNVGFNVSSPQHPVHIDGPSGSVQFRAGVTYAGTGLDIKATENSDVTIDVNDSTKTVARALVFSQAGAERLRITSAGLVGVGTSSPNTILHTAQDASTYIRVQRTSAGTEGNLYLGCTSSANQIISEGSSSVAKALRFDVGSTEAMRITSAGLVGVGTTSPATTFEVNGTGYVTDLLIRNNVGTPSLGTSPWLYSPASGALAIATNAAERLRIDSSGRVGIGTTSPGTILHLAGNNTASTSDTPAATIRLEDTDTSTAADQPIGKIEFYGNDITVPSVGPQAYILSKAAGTSGGGDIRFGTCTSGTATESARLTSDRKWLVGTSSARGGFDNNSGVSSNLQVEGAGTAAGGTRTALSIVNNGSADADSAGLYLARSGGTSVGSFTAVTADDILGRITFSGADGSEFVQSASIEAVIDGTPGANDMPGRLVFSTTADGASSPTNRIIINSAGTMYPATDNAFQAGSAGFRWTAIFAVNGTIQTSDARQKTDISSCSLGSAFIKSLQPISYKWIEGGNTVAKSEDGKTDVVTPVPGERTHWGFLAQDVKAAVDDAGVDFGGWILTDKDDPDSAQGLRYDQFIAPLTKALQETMAELEALKAEVAALKAQ